jgi:hypothetical protein
MSADDFVQKQQKQRGRPLEKAICANIDFHRDDAGAVVGQGRGSCSWRHATGLTLISPSCRRACAKSQARQRGHRAIASWRRPSLLRPSEVRAGSLLQR